MTLPQETIDELNKMKQEFKDAVKAKRWCKKEHREIDNVEVLFYKDSSTAQIIIECQFEDDPPFLKGYDSLSFSANANNILQEVKGNFDAILEVMKSC